MAVKMKLPAGYPPYTGSEPCTRTPERDIVWFGADDDHRPGWEVTDNRAKDYARVRCAACPLLSPCMRYAVEAGERHGIWGATTAHQRAVIRQMPEWPVWDAVALRWRTEEAS